MNSLRRRPEEPGEGQAPAWGTPRSLVVLLGVAIAYYALARVGLLFSLSDTLASPVWPPTGLAIAAVALWRGPALAGVFAGAVVAEWAASGSPLAALGLGLGNTLEALVGGFLLARYGGAHAFRRVSGVGGFVMAAGVAPLLSVGFGVVTLLAVGRVPLDAAPTVAWTWYLGDLAGALVIAPAILLGARAWRLRATPAETTPVPKLEAVAALVALFGLAALIFGILPGTPEGLGAPAILLMPLLVWVGYRLAPAVAAASMVALDALAIAATRIGKGPFVAPTTNDAFLHLQAFVLVVATMVLTLGAWSAERRRAQADLEAKVADRTARLAASHRDLAEAQRIARLGSWALDAGGQMVTASPVMFGLLGLEPRTGPVPLAETQVHLDGADLAAAEVLMAAARSLRTPISYDLHVHPPGAPVRILHVEGQVDPTHGNLVGTAQDVTRQRQAEAALRASNKALAEAQRIAGIGSWALDPGAHKVSLSQEMSRLLGLPHQEGWAPSSALLGRIDPTHRPAAEAALRTCVEQQTPLSFELLLRPVDGAQAGLWLHMEGRLDPASGQLMGTGQDVTADHAAEEALRESLERFRVLAEASPLGIFHTTLKGEVDYANPRWMEIAGCDFRDFAAIRAAVHPEDLDRLTQAWRAALGSGTDLVSEFRYRHKDGKVVECVTRASPVRDASGALTGYVGTVEDATERHRLEARQREMHQLREQARFKTEFLRTAAHELGNPLTPIRIQLRLLKDIMRTQGPDSARRGMEILDRNVERLGLLVRDMLESARLQAGRMRLLPHEMDLSHVVHDVTETFQESAIQLGIALDLEAPPTLPMVADPDRITQVLYNLLSNAMKFTPAGGWIHVRVASEGHMARIVVEDSGAGFTPDQEGGLFQPFGQVHDAVPGKGGTGLGLYISKGIVEQHGGRLSAHSDGPDRGSTFTVVLPLMAAPQPKAEGPASWEEPEPRAVPLQRKQA